MFLSNSQFGVRKGRSTVDAIFALNAIIQNVLNEKEQFGVRKGRSTVNVIFALNSIIQNVLNEKEKYV